jgi:hypothetical protein
MKSLTQTFGLSLIFSAVMLFSNLQPLQAKTLMETCSDSSKVEKMDGAHDPDTAGEFDFDFEDPFFFNEKIVVTVYNQHDELIFNETFTKEESRNDEELRNILKKSEFLLSIGNQYYYYSKQ